MAFTSDNDKSDILAVVLCGLKSEPCKASAVLEEQHSVAKVVSLYTCDDANSVDSLFSCELEIVQQLKEAVSDSLSKVSAIVVDSKAFKSIGKFVHKIFSSRMSRKKLLVELWFAIRTKNGGVIF
mmetsp:Transcript_43317/g.50734  ORF Transcript_43317/g.50734 Transcript_43317/m.50734 type:complete len:125 (+) Transcript_43317:561-935(+)